MECSLLEIQECKIRKLVKNQIHATIYKNTESIDGMLSVRNPEICGRKLLKNQINAKIYRIQNRKESIKRSVIMDKICMYMW